MKNFRPNHFFTQICACTLIVVFTLHVKLSAQATQNGADAVFIRKIYDQALTDGRCYPWLEHLCLNIGHRLSGSVGATQAVQWTRSMLDTLGLDSVWLQPVMVPHWVRGEAEQVRVVGSKKYGTFTISALALGGSVGTPAQGISAEVVEVKTWEELDDLGERAIRGKIVFYNRPMDATKIRTFEAYGGAVDQRVHGASRAAKYGAVGVLVRSMSLRLDDFPHTGTLLYDSTHALLPAVAISTLAAEKLSQVLKEEGKALVSMKMNCKMLPEVLSHNVIGEIRGTERPNDIIVVGGHLDSWDAGHGAHDDGAGCTQSMDVLRILKQLGYRPRHTIRCVLFMNEENGLRGGKKYAEEAARKGEFHLAAIESDAGGFTPRGFSFEGDESVFGKFFEKISTYQNLLEPYGLKFTKGGSGADISPLKSMKGLLSGYQPDSQRYFDLHHTADDTFDKVNKRELELGAASMAALVYLLDKYGL
ncbi:MAG: M20/M25/M40 family metallo-hydrolase [Saprospiraceae bacterium]|nr:M20/M25/M40 family metallo-hydrolase [Saprospiraceae bacterium]